MDTNYLDKLYQYIEIEKIDKLCVEKSIEMTNETKKYISSSIEQGKNFLESSVDLDIATSPLFVYYGYVNIIQGMACLVSNEIPLINGHGLDIKKSTIINTNFITEIEFLINSEGAFPLYYEIFKKEKINNGARWFLGDILGSIVELFDYNSSFNKYSRIMPIKSDWDGNHEFYIVNGEYEILFHELQKESTFKENFIFVCRNSKSDFIFRKKHKASSSSLQYRNSRLFYKLSYEDKGSVEQIDDAFLYYIILFTLSYLVRYCPEYWIDFIRDNTNKGIIDKIISSTSVLPKLIIELMDADKKG